MLEERVLKELKDNSENKKAKKDLKEIKILQEKIGKIQVNFQKVVKEKSYLTSEIASKDKEFLNLQKKYENLLHSVS
jgi:predicted nuclease with TOPRIM domain